MSALVFILTDTLPSPFFSLSLQRHPHSSSGLKIYKKLFLIFIVHEIINFNFCSNEILKTFMLLFIHICTYYPLSSSLIHPCLARSACRIRMCRLGLQREINTRFAKKQKRKNNFSLHVRSKKHLGLKRIIGHYQREGHENWISCKPPRKANPRSPSLWEFPFLRKQISIPISNNFRSAFSANIKFFPNLNAMTLKTRKTLQHPYERSKTNI